jgi:hypothetical protein
MLLSGAMTRLQWTRRWLFPMTLLSALALLAFAGVYLLDHWVSGGVHAGAPGSALERYLGFEPDKLTDAISALSGIIAGVLAIVLTVVSIIVQLSADRYTGVALLFMRDRVNQTVLSYYVIACVCAVWLSVGLHEDFVPRATLLLVMAAASFGLVLMLPYFAYVFWFLDPGNLVLRISRNAMRTVCGAAHARAPARIAQLQVSALAAMAELTDITSNSISGKDKIIACRSIDAFKDFTREYLTVKAQAPDRWFRVGEGIRDHPDFVAMDPESLADLEARRTWIEWQVMRQYLGIYNEALSAMPDVNYLIAIDTRYIGEAAGKAGDEELMRLVFRYMNSYLRATLNARDVRTAYNVLNQYRLLVEAMLRQGHGTIAVEGVRHMNYYGHVSFDMKLTFVTETVAYDVSALCQLAHDLKAAEHDEMLQRFLELDRPLRRESQEGALLGVRKAQVKLAAYYLLRGASAPAGRIADDMREEPAARLVAIREVLEGIDSKDFWEIIDRGRNFDYMPPEQRAWIGEFFASVERARDATR